MINKYNKNILGKLLQIVTVMLIFLSANAYGQYDIKWLNAGSYHNWYSAIGSEIEEGFVKQQQYGARWPAIYNYQDMQCAKSLWIGCKDITVDGKAFPYYVTHVGPRVTGANEFFPGKMKVTYKYKLPLVTVDGAETFLYEPASGISDADVNPNQVGDMMVYNEATTKQGLKMIRKIYQFSQQFNDNYHVAEYYFINTGSVAQTLNDVVFFFQYRWAVARDACFASGANGTRWGMNTMVDARGDGFNKPGDKADEKNLRTQFAWHGYFGATTTGKPAGYSNIGGPIWASAGSSGYIAANDTVGRLGASQFIGVLTAHADASATNRTDDQNQPFTTIQASSDDPKTSQNDALNPSKGQSEYLEWMTAGRKFIWNGVFPDRHAYIVTPDGKFDAQRSDPTLGSPGGFSAMNGYGPYKINTGDTIKLVIIEGANGMSREASVDIGRKYKSGVITAAQKDLEVMKGKDSLMMTWKRAIDGFKNNWNFQKPPLPPKSFSVEGLGNRIALRWEKPNDPKLKGFRIYRAEGQLDSTYRLIYETNDLTKNSFDDITANRGLGYYYYIVSVGDAIPANPALGIPADVLVSSRYYTQTFDPAKLKRPPVESTMDSIRIVPNPFSLGSNPSSTRFGSSEPNSINFYDIPSNCTIRIYTEMGELIKTIEHKVQSGDEYWNSMTDNNQVIVSGIYIVLITNNDTGAKKILKLSVIR